MQRRRTTCESLASVGSLFVVNEDLILLLATKCPAKRKK